jgi:hypothetical protein
MKRLPKLTGCILTALLACSAFTGCVSESESNDTSSDSTPVSADVTVINFDDLSAGTQIDTADSTWKTEKVNGTTLLANVSSDVSMSGANSLYLNDGDATNKPYAYKAFAAGPAQEGSVSFYAYVPSSNVKSVYANVGTSKNNADRYVEIKFSGSGKVEYEYGSEDQEIAKVIPDSWIFCKIAWATDGTFDVYINDQETPVATAIPVYSDFAANFPTQVTFYVGDTKSDASVVYIDDVQSDLF